MIAIVTVLLAAAAVMGAMLLYKNKNRPIAPTAPKVSQAATAGQTYCELGFTVTAETPTITITPPITITPTVTITITPTVIITPTTTGQPNSCGGTCGSNSNCGSGLFCYQGFCRNPICQDAANCVCGSSTNNCGGTCGSNNNCNGGLFCYQGFCRNPICQDANDCVCRNGESTPIPTPTTVVLEESGSTEATWLMIIGGISLLGAGGWLMKFKYRI